MVPTPPVEIERTFEGARLPMSGPIVRKYGFPNYERIFGEKEVAHGVEDAEEATPEAAKEAGKVKKTTAQKKGVKKKAKG
jgi:hypothetical protein